MAVQTPVVPVLLRSAMITPDSTAPADPALSATRLHPDDSPPATADLPSVRLMCSFGGRIVPRSQDNQLRYAGGDTRIVALNRNNATSFSFLLSKISKFAPSTDIIIKYQLPNEDLDALISVTSDEDLENMMEEYDRLQRHGNSSGNTTVQTPRLRLFLFPTDDSGGFGSMTSAHSMSSQKHDHWFVDALNGRRLERGQSEVSSILSEIPDYLFGLDNNSDEPTAKLKTDPGSPAFAKSSSQYGSTSSVASVPPVVPDLPPVKMIKPEAVESPTRQEGNQQGGGYAPNPFWHYAPESVPVYYMPGTGPPPVRPVQPVQYVHPGQFPVGYRPVYIGAPMVGQQPTFRGYNYPLGPTGIATEATDMQRINPVQIPMYHPAALVPPGVGEAEMRIVRPPQ